MTEFDVVVIGSGPGGYVAAIRASQLGFRTACIDKWGSAGKQILGGTCLNVGCIPSKSLLHISEQYKAAEQDLPKMGINIDKLSIDFNKMLSRKKSIVDEGNKGINYLFKKNKVTSIHAKARILGKEGNRFKLSADDELIITKNIIIATGSRPRSLKGIHIDNKKILDNEGALDLSSPPAKLGIIGAGVIGLELGSIWSRLGSEVTIFEYSDVLLPFADSMVSKEMLKHLNKGNMKIMLGKSVESAEADDNGISLRIQDYKTKEFSSYTFNNLLVSIGRDPYTEGLNLESLGLELDERSRIIVNDSCMTKISGVYAIGDVVRGPMLAHKASEEGMMVAELMAGQKPAINYNFVPSVIYTHPEAAWVGKTEEQLKNAGIKYKSGEYGFVGNSRAKSMYANSGKIKILAEAETDMVLGAHIVGPYASELISELVIIMEFYGSSEDIIRIIHAHPTLYEGVKEAALALHGRPVNS